MHGAWVGGGGEVFTEHLPSRFNDAATQALEGDP